MTDLPIRAVTNEELPAFARATALQFGETVGEDFIEVLRELTEFDRTFAAFEGDRIVGTAETISFRMGVPGADPVPCAGLTSVGVHPSRRRRGLLSALMGRQLADARERGEPVAALYASESGIYGRFGYGAAAPAVSLVVDAPWGRLSDPPAARAEVDLIDTEAALTLLPPIYERAHVATGGMMSRAPERWRAFVGFDPEAHRDGYTPYFVAHLPERGYAVYRIREGWGAGVPDGRLRIVELVATDAEAHAALWAFCLEMDLVAHVEASQRPPDDPVRLSLVDPQRLRAEVGDPLWVRLLDLPAAIGARAYAAAADVVVAVGDATCPWNAGTWRLEVAADGAACTRVDAAADLTLDVADLGAAYLGGVRLSALVRARRVEEHRSGAAWALDRALAADPLPWNPRIF